MKNLKSASNVAFGPTSRLSVRFYPISEQYVVKVKTRNFEEFEENKFKEDLSKLYKKSFGNAEVLINDMTLIPDLQGNPTNQVSQNFSGLLTVTKILG